MSPHVRVRARTIDTYFSAFRKKTHFSFSDGDTAKTYHYEPVRRLSGVSESGRNLRHTLDVVIAGEVCPFFVLMRHLTLTVRHRHLIDLRRPGARIALSDEFDYLMG